MSAATIEMPIFSLQLKYKCAKQLFSTTLPLLQDNNKLNLPHCQLSYAITQLPNEKAGFSFQLTIKPYVEQFQLQFAELTTTYTFSPQCRLFCNGFQSWTETREFAPDEQLSPISRIAQPFLHQFGDYSWYRYSGQKGLLHSWTYGYIRYLRPSLADKLLFIGSLAEHTGYTAIIFDVAQRQIRLNKELGNGYDIGIDVEKTLFYCLWQMGNEAQVFSEYAQWWQHLRPQSCPIGEPAAGWTSWYYYYTQINEQIIADKVQSFAERQLPLQYIQIDDGWQQAVGDWTFANAKFGQGMAVIAQKIHEKGYKAGLWLAPMVCESQSTLYKNHPEWLMRDEQGQLVKAAFNPIWQSWMYPLNFYHVEVRRYLQTVFRYIFHHWQFDMVKLDFLYAAALVPPAGKTRGEVMHEVMQWIRECCADKVILGCGVPLSSAFGTTNYCRIGADVHLGWELEALKWLGSRERASTVLSLRNTLYRRQLNGLLLGNDPDVYILRHNRNWLLPEQRYTLFLLNQVLGRLLFTSDDVAAYDETTWQLYRSQFPIKPKQIWAVEQSQSLYQIYFGLANRYYIVYSNFSENIQSIQLMPHPNWDKGNPYLFYHTGAQNILLQGTILELQPFQTICFLLTDTREHLVVAGSTFHLFAGSEIEEVRWHNGQAYVRLHPQAAANGKSWVWSGEQQQIFLAEVAKE